MKIKQVTMRPTSAKRTWQDTLLEAIAAYLMAVSAVYLIAPQFVMSTPYMTYEASVADIWWQPLAMMVVLALLSVKKWLLPAVAGVAAVGYTASVTVTGQLTAVWQHDVGFFSWWFQNLPNNSPYYNPDHFTILYVLLEILICLAVWAVIRLTHHAWPAFVMGITLWLLVLFLGDESNNALSLIILIAGALPLFSRDAYVRGKWHHRKQKTGVGELNPRWFVQVVAMLLCAVSVVSSLFLLPGDTLTLRSRFFGNATADIQSVTHLYTEQQKQYRPTTLYQLGLQPNKDFLGGDQTWKIQQTDKEGNETEINLERQIATIEAKTENALLLRQTSLDTFTDDDTWESRFTTPYRLHNGLFSKQQEAALSTHKPIGDSTLAQAVKAVSFQATATITMKNMTQSLLSGVQVNRFDKLAKTVNTLLTNRASDVFSFHPFAKDYRYTMTVTQYTLDEMPDKVAGGLALAATDKDDTYTERMRKAYTQLPSDFAERYATTDKRAHIICTEANSRLQKAAMICRFFKEGNGFTYTEKPGNVPVVDEEGLPTNLTEWLLQHKKGYSTYYATAMCLMCRSVDVPARVAVGYRASWDNKALCWQVNGSDAYAWVECYIRNLGWVNFDPSPLKEDEGGSSGSASSSNDPVDTDAPNLANPDLEQPDEKTPDNDEYKYENPPVEEPKPAKALPWATISLIFASMLVGFLLASVIYGILATLSFKPERTTRRFANHRMEVEYYYCDMLRQMALLGFALRSGETIVELCQSAMRADRGNDALLPAAQIMTAVHYSDYVPGDEEVTLVVAAHNGLEQQLKKHQSGFKYWVTRRWLRRRHYPSVRKYR